MWLSEDVYKCFILTWMFLFVDVNIRLIIRDLFIAGSETTATNLQWLLLYMALHPDIQRKCQREIDNVSFSFQSKFKNFFFFWGERSKQVYKLV